MLRVTPAGVNGPPVYADHTGCIMGAFHSSFYFKTADTGFHELKQVRQQAQVFRIHDISALFIPCHVVYFTGTVLLGEIEFPTANLSTGAPVPVPTGQVTAEPASPRIGNAHSSVYKGFQLNFRFAADFFHFCKRQLPGQYYAAGTQIFPGFDRRPVGGVSLRAYMQRHLRNDFPGHGPHTKI